MGLLKFYLITSLITLSTQFIIFLLGLAGVDFDEYDTDNVPNPLTHPSVALFVAIASTLVPVLHLLVLLSDVLVIFNVILKFFIKK